MSTESIVAMLGAIMAAPLAAPLTVIFAPASLRERVTSLGKVSVVIMAVAASRNAFGEAASRPNAAGIPSASFSRGKNRPMTPVEQTRTSSSAHPSESGDLCRHPAGVFVAARSGAGVRVTRIDDHAAGGLRGEVALARF